MDQFQSHEYRIYKPLNHYALDFQLSNFDNIQLFAGKPMYDYTLVQL